MESELLRMIKRLHPGTTIADITFMDAFSERYVRPFSGHSGDRPVSRSRSGSNFPE